MLIFCSAPFYNHMWIINNDTPFLYTAAVMEGVKFKCDAMDLEKIAISISRRRKTAIVKSDDREIEIKVIIIYLITIILFF